MKSDLTDLHSFYILILSRPNEEMKNQLSAHLFMGQCIWTEYESEAAIAIYEYRFDLIFIDQDMVSEELLGLIKTYQHGVPLIAITATAAINDRKRLIARGIDNCLPAPLTLEKIKEALNFWLIADELGAIIHSIQTLSAKLNHNKKLTATLWQSLLTELPVQLLQLEAAFFNQDYDAAYEITHKINGSAKVCSLKGIEQAASWLEESLLNRELNIFDSLYRILKGKISRLLFWRKQILEEIDNAKS